MYNYNFDDQPDPEPAPSRKKAAAKPASKKMLGMTRAQLIILIVMAVFALASVGGMIAMIATTPTVKTPTETPVPTFALPTRALPTETPLPGTATPEPTPTSVAPMTPPEGWIDISGGGMKIFVPPAYRGGDMKSTRAETLDRINSMGEPFNDLVPDLEDAPAEMMFAAVLNEDLPPAIPTSLTGYYEQYPADLALEDFIQPILFQLGSNASIIEKKKMTILGKETFRVVVQTRVSSYEKIIVIYAIKDDIHFWRVQFSTSLNDYYVRQYDFANSIQTISLTKP
jgi:hypothetical protein